MAENLNVFNENIAELICAKCGEVFQSRPAILVCDYYICDLHLSKYINEEVFDCTFCNYSHTLDVKRNPELEKKLIKYNHRKLISEMRDKLDQYEMIRKDPAKFIREKFETINQLIEKRKREIENLVIDHFNKFVEELELEREQRSEKLKKSKNPYADDIESLNELKNRLSEFKNYLEENPNHYIYYVFSQKLKVFEKSLEEKIKSVKCELLGNKLYYLTVGSDLVDFKDVFGKIDIFPFTGLKIVSADKSGIIKIWNLDETKCVKTIDAHENRIICLKVAENEVENKLVSYGIDRRVIFRDIQSNNYPSAILKFGRYEQIISDSFELFSHENEQILSVSCNNTFRLFNLKDPNDYQETIIKNHQVTCAKVHFEPVNSKNIFYIITGSLNSNVFIFQFGKTETHSVNMQGIDLDEKQDWTVCCLELINNSSNKIKTILSGHINGSILCFNLVQDENEKYVPDLLARSLFNQHKSKVTYLKSLENTNYFLSASSDGLIKKWNLASKVCELTINCSSDPFGPVLVLNDDFVVVGTLSNLIKIFSLDAKEKGRVYKTLEGHNDKINVLIKTRFNDLISASDDKTIKFWNIETASCRFTLEGHKDIINSLDYFVDNDLIENAPDEVLTV